MFKILKDLKEFNASKERFQKFKAEELDYIEFDAKKEEFEEFKNIINEYKKNKDKFEEFVVLKNKFNMYLQERDDFEYFLEKKEDFDSYKKALGDGKRPHFMMYASELDREGNVSFTYDFNPEFVDHLRQQGMQGISDMEIVEAYLHFIFSQNYFFDLLSKKDDEDKEKTEKKDK